MKIGQMLAAALAGAALACSPAPEPVVAAAPAQAPGPAAVVRAIYDAYGAEQPPAHIPWTRDLAARWESGRARAGTLDPFVLAVDWDFRGADVRLLAPPADGRAIVDVTFVNFGTPTRVLVDTMLEDGEWRIDNVRGSNPPFDLRARLGGA